MRQIGQLGLERIKEWEGYRPRAYLDSAGVPTIGYGHTRGVSMGDTCTKAQAEQWLREDLRIAEEALERATGNGVRAWLDDNQFAALVSFIFNVGAASFRTSTLRQRLVAGDLEAVPGEMRRWIKATVHGEKMVVEGLVNRRKAEIALWMTPDES